MAYKFNSDIESNVLSGGKIAPIMSTNIIRHGDKTLDVVIEDALSGVWHFIDTINGMTGEEGKLYAVPQKDGSGNVISFFLYNWKGGEWVYIGKTSMQFTEYVVKTAFDVSDKETLNPDESDLYIASNGVVKVKSLAKGSGGGKTAITANVGVDGNLTLYADGEAIKDENGETVIILTDKSNVQSGGEGGSANGAKLIESFTKGGNTIIFTDGVQTSGNATSLTIDQLKADHTYTYKCNVQVGEVMSKDLVGDKGKDGTNGTNGTNAHVKIVEGTDADGLPSCVVKTWVGEDESTAQVSPNLIANVSRIEAALNEIMNGTIDVTR